MAGGLLFTELGRSWRCTLSFVFGAAISGMVYANLSAGIIKSVSSAKAAQASGLFVASLYIPAAFAGYLLGHLKAEWAGPWPASCRCRAARCWRRCWPSWRARGAD